MLNSTTTKKIFDIAAERFRNECLTGILKELGRFSTQTSFEINGEIESGGLDLDTLEFDGQIWGVLAQNEFEFSLEQLTTDALHHLWEWLEQIES